MKFSAGLLLAVLCPGLALADVAGTWEGVLNFPAQTLRIVLHITGPDNDLKATGDSPDQDTYRTPASAITFTGATLNFEFERLDVKFTGDLLSDGSITGTFVQHGNGVPVVFRRSEGVPPPPATGSVKDGRYHHDETGLEFDVPAGFSDVRTMPYANDRGQQVSLLSKDNGFIMAWIARGKVAPNRISKILDGEVPAKVARRKGPFKGYEIPGDSVQRMAINGEQAVKATAYYSGPDGTKMVELLTWICSGNAIVHFYAMVPAEKLPALQGAFDQMVLSAKLP
ncbi:MAG: hypothetical protein ABSB15_18700 [Bryobacteraceae bacterium]|jgi:hypothetical protein